MFGSMLEYVKHNLKGVTVDDVLYYLGLERRTSAVPKFLLLGVGVLVGAGVGLMLAPRSGRELRHQIGDRFGDLRTKIARGNGAHREEPGTPAGM